MQWCVFKKGLVLRMKKKIGVFGGTFNPIHTGHLILAEAAYEEFGLDEILFVPTGISNLKDPSVILDKKTTKYLYLLCRCDIII